MTAALRLPDFGADLRSELEAGMAEHRAEIEAIAALRSLTGREPSAGPLLERRGLPTSAGPQP